MIWRKGPSTRCPSQGELAASFVSEPDRFENHRHGCEACSRSWADVQQITWQLTDTLSRDSQGRDRKNGACPDVAAWADLADGRIQDWARLALVEHMAECDDCSALWRYMVDRERPGKEGKGPTVESDGAAADERDHPSKTIRLLLAAAGLATLLVYVLAPPPAIESGGAERWRGPAPLLESEVTWSDGMALPLIQWQPWPDADGYRLRVWDLRGNLLDDHFLESSVLSWQIDIDQPHAGTFYWLVEAIRGGRVVATGEVEVLTIQNTNLPRPPDSR